MHALVAATALCLLVVPAHAHAEGSRPCASTATDKEPEWMEGSFEKRIRGAYSWRKSGALASVTTSAVDTNPERGDAFTTTSYEHDRAGRPTKLSYRGKLESSDGKRVVREEEETWVWRWRSGLLREVSWTRASASGRQRVTTELSWPAGSKAVAPWLGHVALMTWLDSSSRTRRELYAFAFGGAAGEVRAEVTACRDDGHGNKETCTPPKALRLAYDARGRVEAIAGDGSSLIVGYGEHGIGKMVKYPANSRHPATHSWEYDSHGRLVVVSKDQVVGGRMLEELHTERHPDGTVSRQRRVSRLWDHSGKEAPPSETPLHTWSYRCSGR